MSGRNENWAGYKATVLDALGDFSAVYGGLKKQRPSGDGWISALCPFHEDTKPSFSFDTATGNWTCHAGCGNGSVIDYLMKKSGRSFKEELLALGDQFGVEPPSTDNTKVLATQTFDYHDENGQLLFQVLKSPSKKFFQRRPNGNGGWIKNLKGVRRVLYKLPDLKSRPRETVFVVEGEKDADRLHHEGLLATTNPGGAGKWRAEYSEILRDRDVVILPDNDGPGRAHALRVAEALQGQACTIKIVELPGLAEKGDVSDWIDSGRGIEDLRKEVAGQESWRAEESGQGIFSRPLIQVNDRQQRDVIAEAWSAIHKANDPPSLFVKSRKLVRLVVDENGPRIEQVDEAAAYGHLLRVANWGKITRDGLKDATPPKEVARDLLVNPDPDLPLLESVVTTPVFDTKGRLVTEPGYHPESRLWYHRPDGFELADIPECPTENEVGDAVALLREDLLVDFPFTAESDEAHSLAALLLLFARRLIPGCAPIHLIESPTPGSGKSLLADLISIVTLGRACEPTTLSRDENETRKKITSILARGTPIVLLDNIRGYLDSSQLSSALTAEVWSDRLLGQSVMVEYPNRAMWLVTANNPRLSLEIARRSIRIRIDPGEDRPWERKGFTHDPIRQWARDHRAELVHAALVLVQSWLVAGRPVGEKTLGSYEDWAAVIGGILRHVGVSGFLEDTEEFYAAADQEGQEWRAFVEAWWEKFRDQWVTTSDLYSLAIERDLLVFVLGDKSERSQKIRLGKALSNIRDRRFGDLAVIVGTSSHTKTAQYRLVHTGPDSSQSDSEELFPSLRDVAGCEKPHTAPHPARQQEGMQ